MKTLIIVGLLSMSAMSAAADVTLSGDWGQTVLSEGAYALTSNAEGGYLGQYCSTQGDCGYLVSTGNACAPQQKHSAIASIVTGSQPATADHITMICDGDGVLFILEFDVIDAAARHADSISIVEPLTDGTFLVSWFSLRGAARAIDDMRAAAQKIIRKSKPIVPPSLPLSAKLRI